MSNLTVIEVSGQNVVDSRLISDELGIDHKSFVRTIRKYATQLQAFGVLGFENAKPLEGSVGGRPETFCYLNEEQSIFIMTLSRNTDQVIQCKMNLVKAFSEARNAIADHIETEPIALPVRDTVEYIEAADKLERMSDSILKLLLKDCLVDELELRRNNLALPSGDRRKQYTIVKVRAMQLGYSAKEIGKGTELGRFVKARIKPSHQELVGRFPVYHYEINSDLDTAIHTFFGAAA